ncbi:MAG: hypothetical protein E7284_10910 [Lachnospiraceae bacterium]|nr:hypothetical protein [Lachnospiraceae bacterium]
MILSTGLGKLSGMNDKTASFCKLSRRKRMKLSQEQLDEYWLNYRIDRYERGINKINIYGRKLIHPILLTIVKIERLILKEKLIIIKNEHTKVKGPIIYAATHIGGHDVERCFEAIKKHAFLFLGDPKEIYRNASGILLYLNGVICLETRNKYDRKIAKETAIEILKRGGNLLIYPEGVWNISENILVNRIFKGTASMAIKTDVTIVPLAIEQYENKFLVNIGKNIDSKDYSEKEIDKLTDYLQDKLAELKLEILEYNGIVSRDSLDVELKEKWVENIFAKADFSYTVQDIYDTQYPDEYDKADEVFSFMEKLEPKKENAFLLRYRYKR